MAPRQAEIRRLELHPPRLDLGQVQDVVDERQQVPAGLQDIGEVLGLLLVDLAEHPLGQHFGKADDGVERRAELVRHVREKLALVPARDLELPALVLDLAEEARVLDGEGGLRREGLQEVDDLRRELARRLAVDHQPAKQMVLAH